MATRYKIVLYPEYIQATGVSGFQQPIAPGSVKIGDLAGNDLGDKDYNQKNAIIKFFASDVDDKVTLTTARATGTASPTLKYIPNDKCESEYTATLTDTGDGINFTVDDATIAGAIKGNIKDLLHFELTI